MNTFIEKLGTPWEYIKKNFGRVILWLITGGVITLWGFWDKINSGANIAFVTITAPRWGYQNDNGKTYAQYLVEASLFNSGDKPFYPISYKMKVSYGNMDAIFTPYSLTDSFYLPLAPGSKKISLDYRKDLTRVTKIEPDGIVTGFLWFRLELTQNNQMIDFTHYNSIKFQIFDINGKKTETKAYHYLPFDDGKGYYPKNGIEVK